MRVLVIDVGGTHVKLLLSGKRASRRSTGASPGRAHVNPGHGWVGYDFAQAFGRPMKIQNDAAMQALGSYRGGRMLFLGLGTGLGSAMVVDEDVQPMELAHLPYKKGRTYEDYVGLKGFKRLGVRRWRKQVRAVIETLRAALEPDDVVIGGGNAVRLTELPRGVRLGDNANAFKGGFRLWRTAKGALDRASAAL